MPSKNTKSLSALFAGAFLAAGCGSGGGSRDADTPDNSWLQLTPSSVDVSVVAGIPQNFTVTAKSNKTISQAFNVGIVDKTGLIDPVVNITTKNPSEYIATLKVANTLQPGSYSTRLEVRLCEDDPSICAKPIQGSPWYVPLNVAVKSANNLTPLSDLPNGRAWQGIGGSIAHAAFVPGSFDPAKFSTRFLRTFNSENRFLMDDLTIENGVVYMSVMDIQSVSEMKGPELYAVDEATNNIKWSSQVWSPQLSQLHSLKTAPVIIGDQLYVGVQSYTAAFRTFNKATGASDGTLFEVGGNYASYVGIQAHSGGLLVSGGSDGLKRVNTNTFQVDWTAKAYYPASPTADADNVYLFDKEYLSVVRASDGALLAAPFITSSQCRTSAIHATDGHGNLYGVCYGSDRLDPFSRFNPDVGSELHAIDTLSKQPKWSVTGPYSPSVALGATTLYALKTGVLEARDVNDGKLLWWINLLTGPDALREAQTVLLTENLVFVSSKAPTLGEIGKTVAVDLTTHKVVWSYPHGGKMAISSKGVLYIGGDQNYSAGGAQPAIIAAINLR